MHGGGTALKNAWFGKKNGLEGGMALDNKWFGENKLDGMDAWIWRMHGLEKECTGRMYGLEEFMALKNAWFGNKNEPEGCRALKQAWFVEIEWTGRMHEKKKKKWTGRMHVVEECMEDAWL